MDDTMNGAELVPCPLQALCHGGRIADVGLDVQDFAAPGFQLLDRRALRGIEGGTTCEDEVGGPGLGQMAREDQAQAAATSGDEVGPAHAQGRAVIGSRTVGRMRQI